MLKYYDFDPKTGAFTGEFDAPIDPLETRNAGYDVYMRPAHCTDVVPPATDHGMVPVWRDEAWVVMPDHRGEVWYALADDAPMAVVVDFAGDPRERGLVTADELPKPVPVLSPFRFKLLLVELGIDADTVKGAILASGNDKRYMFMWDNAPWFDVKGEFVRLLIDASLLDEATIAEKFREVDALTV